MTDEKPSFTFKLVSKSAAPCVADKVSELQEKSTFSRIVYLVLAISVLELVYMEVMVVLGLLIMSGHLGIELPWLVLAAEEDVRAAQGFRIGILGVLPVLFSALVCKAWMDLGEPQWLRNPITRDQRTLIIRVMVGTMILTPIVTILIAT